jgi:hypothetical protein
MEIDVKQVAATAAPQNVQFAFPCIGSMVVKKTTLGQPEMVSAYQTGMSLRDYFAGEAIHQSFADLAHLFRFDNEDEFITHVAVLSYKLADAMIAERSKKHD